MRLKIACGFIGLVAMYRLVRGAPAAHGVFVTGSEDWALKVAGWIAGEEVP